MKVLTDEEKEIRRQKIRDYYKVNKEQVLLKKKERMRRIKDREILALDMARKSGRVL